ncbi:DedA family protein [Kitasatospora griseola]|uniref:DedA family protein n=1 Tax=Kitasatospora griseola TaxID=2064 RepID=UPI0005C5A9C9|nr:DedA family protein [Kitasatospora griseola]
MHAVTDWLRGLSGPVVYAVVGALVFAEDALFFGFVLPGETAAVLGGLLAHQGKVSLGWMVLVVVSAAVIGDSTGYEVGRRLGPAVLRTRTLRKHADRVEGAQDLIRRRGPVAVLLGRFVAFFRALMPALAGVSRMPYPRFLLFNAIGGVLWGIGFTLLGYFAGSAYSRVEGTVGRSLAIAVAAVVVVALVVWRVRAHRRESRESRADRPDDSPSDNPGERSGESPDDRGPSQD